MEGVGESEREREKGKARCHPDHPDHHNTSLVSNTTKPHPATTTAAGASAPCWKENAGKEKRTKITRSCAGRTNGREEPKPFCPTISPSVLSPPLDINPARGDAFGAYTVRDGVGEGECHHTATREGKILDLEDLRSVTEERYHHCRYHRSSLRW